MTKEAGTDRTAPTVAATPAVNGHRLWQHLIPFSTTVRDSGSPAELEAFKYAEGVLREAGFETALIHHPAYISLPGPSRISVGSEELSCITHSMAVAVPDGFTATLALDEAPSFDGEIIVAHGLATPGKVLALQARGAGAVVIVNSGERHEMIVSPVWGNPDLDNLGDIPTIPVVSVDNKTGSRILQLASQGASATIVTNVDTGWREVPLLEAVIEPPDGDGSTVLFSGHIDSWHLGAMDNGGANAVMLEVATLIAESREHLKRSLRVLFWSGHSHGRYSGSAWYGDQHFEFLRDNVVLHVNIDSVGGVGATVLNVAPSMAEAYDLACAAIAQETDEPYAGGRMGRSADQSFFGHGVTSIFNGISEQPITGDGPVGAAALLGGGGYGWWWHTTEDTLDKLDPKNLERDARIYMELMNRVCRAPTLPLRYSRTATEIKQRLKEYQLMAGRRLDLSRPMGLADELVTKLQEYEKQVEEESRESDWRVQKAIAKHLVPLNYVAGSVYEQDPALPQPALPGLKQVEDLVNETDEDRVMHRLVKLVRERNRVVDVLRKALAVVEGVLRA